jgi:hypothetical protein
MDTIDYGRIIVLMKDGSQGSAFDIEKEVLFGRCANCYSALMIRDDLIYATETSQRTSE